MDQLMSQNTNNFNLESNFDSVKRITDDQRTETSEASGEDVPERIRTRFRVKVQLWRHRDGAAAGEGRLENGDLFYEKNGKCFILG